MEYYYKLSLEIYAREARVASQQASSKSITELRAKLEKPYYYNSNYNDKSLAELLLNMQANQQKLKITEENEYYVKSLKELQDQLKQFPRYNQLQEIFYGNVLATFTDADLNDLRMLMFLKTRSDVFLLFLNPLRMIYRETCTIGNVTLNWLGLNRLVYRGTLRSITDAEKALIDRKKTEPPESN
jgi:hypothetical protein